MQEYYNKCKTFEHMNIATYLFVQGKKQSDRAIWLHINGSTAATVRYLICNIEAGYICTESAQHRTWNESHLVLVCELQSRVTRGIYTSIPATIYYHHFNFKRFN